MNIFNIKIIFILIAFTFTMKNWAQKTKSLSPEKVLELDQDFIKKKETLYNYIPVDEKYWEDVQEKIKNRELDQVIEEAGDRVLEFGEENEEGKEALLALAEALLKKKYYISSFYIIKKLIKENLGTNFSQQALVYLEVLAENEKVNEFLIKDTILNNDFSGVHEQSKGFINYHKYIFNLKNRLDEWAIKKFKKISEDSYWVHKINYLVALNYITVNKIEDANQIFIEIEKNSKSKKLVNRAKLNQARIFFEKGKFEEALEKYKSVSDLSQREHGRVLLEMAWVNFYLKKYSEALGLLMTLKSPRFYKSIVPERYILEMVIYKELCHYRSVKLASREYKRKFKRVLRHIKNRKNLLKNRILFSVALLDRTYQISANIISQIYKEKKALKKWMPDIFIYRELNSYLKKTSYVLRKDIDSRIDKKIRSIAKEFIEVNEQIKYLTYSSELEKIRPSYEKKTEENYKPEKIKILSFNKIFWPLEKEYWSDELFNLKALIKSQCTNGDFE